MLGLSNWNVPRKLSMEGLTLDKGLGWKYNWKLVSIKEVL